MEATLALAHYVVESRLDDVPEAARHAARRSLVNWLGCALGGSHHEAVSIALAALAPFSGPPRASVLGRCERLDILHAALVNGMSAHVLDFDDTHLRTLLHLGVFGAAAAAGRVLGLDEQRITRAFGVAATQAAGPREMAGTMCKSFVHGRVAQNGMTAAQMNALLENCWSVATLHHVWRLVRTQ